MEQVNGAALIWTLYDEMETIVTGTELTFTWSDVCKKV